VESGLQSKSSCDDYIICQTCKELEVKAAPNHIYCRPCSEENDRQRTRNRVRVKGGHLIRKERITMRGLTVSETLRGGMIAPPEPPKLLWWRSVSLPFSRSVSKNHIFSNASNTGGHRGRRAAQTTYKKSIVDKFSPLLTDVSIVQNKLWIDIFQQKPHQKGDAVNCVDVICDALKEVTRLDDRWFSIRSLDWQIVKHNPMVFIGIGQDSNISVQACSSCGALKTFELFQRNRSTKNGISRYCLLCTRDGDATRRAAGKGRKPC
jgi:hypothetical protein